jgi:hypothetical protein
VVDAEEVGAVGEGVVETLGGDLGELAGADPARGDEGVDRRDVNLPVGPSRRVAAGETLAIVEEALLVAVPLVRLDGEGVGRVGRPLVVAMDLEVSGWQEMLLLWEDDLPARRT